MPKKIRKKLKNSMMNNLQLQRQTTQTTIPSQPFQEMQIYPSFPISHVAMNPQIINQHALYGQGIQIINNDIYDMNSHFVPHEQDAIYPYSSQFVRDSQPNFPQLNNQNQPLIIPISYINSLDSTLLSQQSATHSVLNIPNVPTPPPSSPYKPTLSPTQKNNLFQNPLKENVPQHENCDQVSNIVNNPKPSPKRVRKEKVEISFDEKRKKNSEAAKRSRKKRKEREIKIKEFKDIFTNEIQTFQVAKRKLETELEIFRRAAILAKNQLYGLQRPPPRR